VERLRPAELPLFQRSTLSPSRLKLVWLAVRIGRYSAEFEQDSGIKFIQLDPILHKEFVACRPPALQSNEQPVFCPAAAKTSTVLRWAFSCSVWVSSSLDRFLIDPWPWRDFLL